MTGLIARLTSDVLVPSSVIEGWLRECSSPERIEARLQEWKRQHPTNWNVLG